MVEASPGNAPLPAALFSQTLKIFSVHYHRASGLPIALRDFDVIDYLSSANMT
jgi:hypothetical protein